MLRSLLPTFLTALVVGGFIALPYLGFALYLLVLVLFPWLLYSVFVMVVRPASRVLQLQKVGIWTLAILLVVAVHVWRHVATQRQADRVVHAVQAYADRQGYYPKGLDAVGISKLQLRSQIGYVVYLRDGTKPYFSYRSTYAPFDNESYDFEARAWRHMPD